MADNHSDTERRLWNAADEFRANSDLKSTEYAVPALGLIFHRYADHRFTIAEKELEGKGTGRRKIPKLISGKLDVEDLDIDVGEPIETLEEATA